MRCPRCKQTLQNVLYEGVDIETCPGCKGEWLDAGELKKIVETMQATFSKELLDSVDAVNRNVFMLSDPKAVKLVCPKCEGVRLNEFNYASSTGIALDKCPKCGGVWLDHNELERVQAVVEEWKGKLREDEKKFGLVLRKIREDNVRGAAEGASVPRFALVNAILRRFL